jgi:hypothetical protein
MEPFITKNGDYLFFNSYQGVNGKDLYYADRISDITFEFKGEIQGVNASYLDGNPTMDELNNFYFVSTRNLDTANKTVYGGVFDSGTVTGLHQIKGTINVPTPYWINKGVEISKDENTLFTSNVKFSAGKTIPRKGDLRFAVKTGNVLNTPSNQADILANINTDGAIEYAGELSADELELFYSQLTLSSPPVFKLYHAKREQIDGVFGKPISIEAPFEDDVHAFVEGPSLSDDGSSLHNHKLENGAFSIFMLSRE